MAPREQRRPATMEDLEALPPHIKGEIIDGVLYTFPRPRPWHSRAIGAISARVGDRYDRGRGGPTGWWILPEPGVELPGSPEFSPDVAGWRRERLPDLPLDHSITVVPDWVCEVLSPYNRRHDLRVKRPFYARIGVGHLWYVDLEARTLSVSELVGGRWSELAVYAADEEEDEVVRAEPFPELELRIAEWWPEAKVERGG